jgi:sarcosine oxidase subunit alpha
MRRLATGGRIGRSRPLTFRFDGASLSGFEGDTLASALLANGVRTVGRSVELGRPRGVYAAGAEEPNAYVQVSVDGAIEPFIRATQVELVDGLEATSANGRARVPSQPDRLRYDKMHAHCDVLVIGGGPSGLAAALTAGRTGARVIVVDDQPRLGGALLGLRAAIDDRPADEWLTAADSELRSLPEVRVLNRATAFGYYDGNCVMVAQRQRLWQIRAGTVILATGAHERPLVFADNDRPGVMLAGAAREYANRFGVACGTRAVVFTNNDSAYRAAFELADAGIDISAIVDMRGAAGEAVAASARERGVRVLLGHAVVGTSGDLSLSAAHIAALGADSASESVECDLLAVSGGFNPVVHLASQAQVPLRFDARQQCFVPDTAAPGLHVVGAAAGAFSLGRALRDGAHAGAEAAQSAGFAAGSAQEPFADAAEDAPVLDNWLVPAPDDQWTTHFVDLHRDTTVATIAEAVGAGLRSIEHVKRYTTAGTGADQGKISGVLTAGVAATLLGQPVASLGTTTFRPPYVPVSFGLLAGRHRADLYDPIRVTPLHDWHTAHGAVFENVGQWKRPWFYPRDGEDIHAAVARECRAAREGVAIMDASTLGEIDVQGPDAAEFLNRVFTSTFDKLPVGAIRYGVLCRTDGMVFDDGVVMRLAHDRFVTSTTTGNAAALLEWLEEWLQTEWPDLRVRLTSVTDHWATVAVVGPRSRDVVRALAPGLDVDNAAFPFMTLRDATVAGVAARVCRVSFSGELAFEINVPAWDALTVWEAAVAAGEPFGITPYGTETMHVLRAEKGYIIVGQDTDGTVTPLDLGLSWLVSRTKADFLGRRSLQRSDTARADRKHLVGLLPLDPSAVLPEGAQLVTDGQAVSQGHVTSSYYSAALGRSFALALLRSGRERHGSVVYAPLADGTSIAATVTEPVFYDKAGERRDG